MLQIENDSHHDAGMIAHELLRKGFAVIWDAASKIVLTTASREQIPYWQRHGRVFSTIEPEKEQELMQLHKVPADPTVHLGSLEPGELFKYPTGDALYQVLRPCGNLENTYARGRKSGKLKVWASNLSNGNTSAVDHDKSVIRCKAKALEWYEL